MNNALNLIGRILLAALFLPAGLSKLSGFEGTVGYIGSVGLPLASVAVSPSNRSRMTLAAPTDSIRAGSKDSGSEPLFRVRVWVGCRVTPAGMTAARLEIGVREPVVKNDASTDNVISPHLIRGGDVSPSRFFMEG